MTDAREKVLIVDFGSQYTQLIARRVREANVFCEIVAHTIAPEEAGKAGVKGIILSGGPASVTASDSPECSPKLFDLEIPVLGICYGLQIMGKLLGGKVAPSERKEYGHAVLRTKGAPPLFKGIGPETQVWMSHGDKLDELPPGFETIGETESSPFAAISCPKKNLYAVQFHPEVVHTPDGARIIHNFLSEAAGCLCNWTMQSFISSATEEIRATVGDEKVICALSGGVDSSVLACLLDEAISDQAICVFVDNGLLRKNEAEEVIERFRRTHPLNLRHVDASDKFLAALAGVTDPEEKRKCIGEVFIRIFEKEAKEVGPVRFLSQGTLYPDLIESHSPFRGPSATIKSHHNVGGLPEEMDLELIEPLRFLFKDEVRQLGTELGLPDEVVWRHPFPGPGLAVRIIGEANRQQLDTLREADAIVMDELRTAGLYREIWQALAVLLPVRTVGVMGDERTYENMISVRAVTSTDGMTADWARIPYDVMGRISNRVINEVKGVNRVVYDISSKPPSTIEYE